MVATNPIGIFQVGLDLTLKYGITISQEDFDITCQRLTNQLWKLLPMRENEENWLRQFDTVINEIVGLNELTLNSRPQFLQLLSKLEGLRKQESTFEFYRKTVFEVINLTQEIKNGN